MKPTGATKETTGEPTPRPWRAVALLPDGLEHHIIAGEFRDGSAIASADNPNGLVAYADMPANAQLIVTAVNERERLREALRDLVECCPCQNGCAPDDMTCATMKARAVLDDATTSTSAGGG